MLLQNGFNNASDKKIMTRNKTKAAMIPNSKSKQREQKEKISFVIP